MSEAEAHAKASFHGVPTAYEAVPTAHVRAHPPEGCSSLQPASVRLPGRFTYVHSYDVDATRRAYHSPISPIPAMRLAPDATAGRSPTPIYDALYSEYRRSFRALPGDRSGEENLRFKRFGDMNHLDNMDLPSSRHRLVALPPAARKGL